MTAPVANYRSTTDHAQLDRVLQAAAVAAPEWSAMSAEDRAGALEGVADALEGAGPELIPVGMRETNLAEGRLQGELKRTAFQLRLFAEVVRDGRHLDARIDHADADWPMGAPRPDLRRYLRPIGPALVFSASNFPFAFSVAGGDTASALAAGNPVVVKAHSGHPELSRMTGDVVTEALRRAGAPEGVFAVVYGREAGTAAVQDRRIKAAGFTGSIPGGRALFDLANARPEPIPFYGELGSNNPVFVTEAAAAERADEIAEGFIGSFTMGTGQFCTKPGTLFVPVGSGLVEKLQTATLPAVHDFLNEGIGKGHAESLSELSGHPQVEVLAQGQDGPEGQVPTLLRTTADAMLADPDALQAECFGPTALVVEYENLDQAVQVARTYGGQLTAGVFGQDDCPVQPLLAVLTEIAGRVIWNQWPTGVSVTYAQQHGGPYPATTAVGTTSVGTAAINRFLRPVAYQNLPQHLLPAELQDANPLGLPQMVDGK
ncbi:aldehyde dehydrogenase (NADP(+)) [Pseudactinotalea sp. Z1739]|uniref:aldehyde dehydrogenase (NADP(+)) n=1 Tax=Pseudactinotalea sp. Z1739 TaxID=3413028 RepID=UPI003C7AB3B6